MWQVRQPTEPACFWACGWHERQDGSADGSVGDVGVVDVIVGLAGEGLLPRVAVEAVATTVEHLGGVATVADCRHLGDVRVDVGRVTDRAILAAMPWHRGVAGIAGGGLVALPVVVGSGRRGRVAAGAVGRGGQMRLSGRGRPRWRSSSSAYVGCGAPGRWQVPQQAVSAVVLPGWHFTQAWFGTETSAWQTEHFWKESSWWQDAQACAGPCAYAGMASADEGRSSEAHTRSHDRHRKDRQAPRRATTHDTGPRSSCRADPAGSGGTSHRPFPGCMHRPRVRPSDPWPCVSSRPGGGCPRRGRRGRRWSRSPRGT